MFSITVKHPQVPAKIQDAKQMIQTCLLADASKRGIFSMLVIKNLITWFKDKFLDKNIAV